MGVFKKLLIKKEIGLSVFGLLFFLCMFPLFAIGEDTTPIEPSGDYQINSFNSYSNSFNINVSNLEQAYKYNVFYDQIELSDTPLLLNQPTIHIKEILCSPDQLNVEFYGKDNLSNIIVATATLVEGKLNITPVKIDECFIATAAYGSKFESSVILLRQFRDRFLLTNSIGSEFVETYYKNSPPIAHYISQRDYLRTAVRLALIPFITLAFLCLHPQCFFILGIFVVLMMILLRNRSKANWRRSISLLLLLSFSSSIFIPIAPKSVFAQENQSDSTSNLPNVYEACSFGGSILLSDVSNNCIRIGKDVYSSNSKYFETAHLLASLKCGGNQAYIKKDGRWYNIFTLSDDYIGQVDKSEKDYIVNGWNLRYWYKPEIEIGELVDTEPPLLIAAIEDVANSYIVLQMNEQILLPDKSTKVQFIKNADNTIVAGTIVGFVDDDHSSLKVKIPNALGRDIWTVKIGPLTDTSGNLNQNQLCELVYRTRLPALSILGDNGLIAFQLDNTVDGCTYTLNNKLNDGEYKELQTIDLTKPITISKETTEGIYTYQVTETSKSGQKVSSNNVKYMITSQGSGILTGDTDSDGLNDELETELGTDKTKIDTDGDSLPDGYEYYFSGTLPLKTDTDEDSVLDGMEDADLDSLTNQNEYLLNTNPQLADSDNDGLDDGVESNQYHTNPILSDTDGDSVSDKDEIVLGLNPLDTDSDNDGVQDNDEKIEQTVNEENIDSSLLSNNDALPALTLSASGNVNNMAGISEYKGVEFGNSRSVVGKPISISGVDFDSAEVSFTLNSIESMSASVPTCNKNLICRYDEEGNTVYYDTDYDSDTNKLSAEIDSPGTYFVLDVEEMFNELGLSLPAEMREPAIDAESVVKSMSQNDIILDLTPEEIESMINPMPDNDVMEPENTDQAEISSDSVTVDNDIEARIATEATGQADIAFIIDTTSSMEGEINNVKNNATAFVDALKERGIAPYFALVDYQDITYDGIDSTKVHKNLTSNWFSNIEDYKKVISNLKLGNGGDTPECAIDALETARLLDMRANAGKFFILVTDAQYKTNNRYGIPSMDYEIELLKNQNINTSVITSSGLESTYESLFTATGGIFANINGEFKNELMTIADKIGEVVDDGVWVYLDGPIPVAVKLKKEPSADDTVTDTDEDGLPDIQELKSVIPTKEVNLDEIITKVSQGAITGTSYGTVKMYEYYSNPAVNDTDYDGYSDYDDLEPKTEYAAPVVLIHGLNKDSYRSFGVSTSFATQEYHLNDHYIDNNIAAGTVVEGLSNSLDKNFFNPFKEDIPSENYYSLEAQLIISIDKIGKRASETMASNLISNGYIKNKNIFAINYPNQDFVWKNADLLKWFLSTLKDKKGLYPTLSAYNNQSIKFILVAEGSGGYIARYYNEILSNGTDVGKLILFETNSDVSNVVGITPSDIVTHTTLIQPINADITDGSMMNGGPGNTYSAFNPFVQDKFKYINEYQTGSLNISNHHKVEYDNYIGVDNNNSMIKDFSKLVKYNRSENNDFYIERDGDLITRSNFDNLFENLSSQYSKDLAELSIEAALYAYDDVYRLAREEADYSRPEYLIDMLEGLGFVNIIPYNYHDNDMHNNSFVLASKEILSNGQPYHLVAVILRGTDSVEWNGDFEIWQNIADLDRKTMYSFEKGKACVYQALKNYTQSMGTNVKLWITGHSRGAAVANLLGAELSNNREDTVIAQKDNIFVYTYATPNVRLQSVINSENVNNIFNFVNSEDFVTKVPLVSWGYGKYGITTQYNINTIKDISGFSKYYALAGQIACKESAMTADAVVQEFYDLATCVEDYYKDLHPLEKYHSLRDFAFNVIANAAQGINIGELINSYLSLTYHGIAAFFVYNEQQVFNKAITYNHNPHTYYAITQYHNSK